MMYRDNSGNAFLDIGAAMRHFCAGIGVSCEQCPLSLANNGTAQQFCAEYAESHPAEAARLMGLERVENWETCGKSQDECFTWGLSDCSICENQNMFEPAPGKEAAMDKPLKDWTLGEVKEYCVSMENCADCLFYREHHEGDCLFGNEEPTGWHLSEKLRFTPEEVEAAKAAETLFGTGLTGVIDRDEYRNPWIRCHGHSYLLPPSLFPSVSPGQTVKLSEIVGGGE